MQLSGSGHGFQSYIRTITEPGPEWQLDPEPARQVKIQMCSLVSPEGEGGRWGPVSGSDAVEASVPQQDWRRQRLDTARFGPAQPGRLQLHPPLLQAPELQRRSRRAQGRTGAAELGLWSVSSRGAAIPLDVGLGSLSAQVRRPRLLLIFPLHGRRAEAAGRKEGRKENPRGATGNRVYVGEARRLQSRLKDCTSQHASGVRGSRWEFTGKEGGEILLCYGFLYINTQL